MSEAGNKDMNRLVVGKPNLMDKAGFLQDVKLILSTRNFTNIGPFNCKLESLCCKFLGVKHVFAVSNATVGLAMMLRALNLRPGGEIVLPAYTFIATAHAVEECGFRPVFCDCDPTSHLMGVKEASACITTDTVAILAVNLWGLSCDVEGLQSLAREKHVSLVFDSAHSFGSRAPCGTFLANFGEGEVFSMHATKLFNSFEGGLITTNNDEVAKILGPMRNFGITGQDQVSCWGSNYKLSEIHAAFSIRQLNKIEELITIYQQNARSYSELFDNSKIRGIRVWNADYLSHQGCTHSYVCIEILDTFPITRDQLIAALRDEDIFAKRYFFPGVHKCQPYIRISSHRALPVTERLCDTVVVLPTGSEISLSDIERVVNVIVKCASLDPKYHRLGHPNQAKISVDKSYLTEQIMQIKNLKAKYEKLAKECAEDLALLEISSPE